jgi:hypothetical protein
VAWGGLAGRVFCGLASSTSSWLSAAVIDGRGQVLDIADVPDNPYGFSELGKLFAERAVSTPLAVDVAADDSAYIVTALLTVGRSAMAYSDSTSVDAYARRFAGDDVELPDGTLLGTLPQAGLRAVGLARALQAGSLSATVRSPAPQYATLSPLVAAHTSLITSRQAATSGLLGILSELWPAALPTYADPTAPVPPAVLRGPVDAGRAALEAGRGGALNAFGGLVRAFGRRSAEAPEPAGEPGPAVVEIIKRAATAVRQYDDALASMADLLAERLNAEEPTLAQVTKATTPAVAQVLARAPFAALDAVRGAAHPPSPSPRRGGAPIPSWRDPLPPPRRSDPLSSPPREDVPFRPQRSASPPPRHSASPRPRHSASPPWHSETAITSELPVLRPPKPPAFPELAGPAFRELTRPPIPPSLASALEEAPFDDDLVIFDAARSAWLSAHGTDIDLNEPAAQADSPVSFERTGTVSLAVAPDPYWTGDPAEETLPRLGVQSEREPGPRSRPSDVGTFFGRWVGTPEEASTAPVPSWDGFAAPRTPPPVWPPYAAQQRSPDAQVINFWIREREDDPDAALIVHEPYTGVFQVGSPRAANLATGRRDIPVRDIPDDGLPTEWIVSSTTVALEPLEGGANDEAIRFSKISSGDVVRWTVSFPLVIPRTGESAERSLRITPMTDQAPHIHAQVNVAGDAYREVDVALRADPRPGDDSGYAPMPDPRPPAVLPPGLLSLPVRQSSPAVEVAESLHVPASQTNLPAAAPWQVPGRSLTLEFLPPTVVIKGDATLNIDQHESWHPPVATMEGVIGRVRRALDKLRAERHKDFDDICADDFTARLTSYRPSRTWGRAAGPPTGGAWAEMSRDPALHTLALEGYSLYEAAFPPGSDLRGAADALEPGDLLRLSWKNTGSTWIPHVPWGLMYCAEPPIPGEPVDVRCFLGLRLRLVYHAYNQKLLNRGMGDSFTRAHLLYWGGADNDETWIEARRHEGELAAWRPLSIPQGVDGKHQVQEFLRRPAPAPVGLVYFFCQGRIRPGADPELRFGSTNRPEDVLGLNDLGTSTLPDRPLIFANACDTAAGDPYVPNQLEHLFFRRQCRAFIGTECKVPIGFAARFAEAFFYFFYTRLPGVTPAGEALAQARKFFWEEYSNIGGIFYSYTNDFYAFAASEDEIAALRGRDA